MLHLHCITHVCLLHLDLHWRCILFGFPDAFVFTFHYTTSQLYNITLHSIAFHCIALAFARASAFASASAVALCANHVLQLHCMTFALAFAFACVFTFVRAFAFAFASQSVAIAFALAPALGCSLHCRCIVLDSIASHRILLHYTRLSCIVSRCTCGIVRHRIFNLHVRSHCVILAVQLHLHPHYAKSHWNALQHITCYCIALHCSAIPCITLQCIIAVHLRLGLQLHLYLSCDCATLRCIAFELTFNANADAPQDNEIYLCTRKRNRNDYTN